jgi:UDP-glucose 4-epimerase
LKHLANWAIVNGARRRHDGGFLNLYETKLAMNVLVTGGAGYIGSHAVRHLRASGAHVAVVDNLGMGHRAAVPADVPFYDLDLRQTARLKEILATERIDCVMHFAALAAVGESVAEPLRYYLNNVAGTLSLLEAMQATGVRRLVFSSTCAVIGIPSVLPIVETLPREPINPYGRSKLMIEHILEDWSKADQDFAWVALRYFNVAGCAADGSLGEDHDPETHLIPILLQVALGQRPSVTLFGTDYPTPDGTCIRDYVHVDDLCQAHILALNALKPGTAAIYNVGIGRGYSVQEVLQAARVVTGHAIPAQFGPRRAGDPPSLFANAAKITSQLAWKPQFTELEPVIETAWKWFRKHPSGYQD